MTKVAIKLDRDEIEDLNHLCARLELEPNEGAARLLMAAVYALQDEEHFIWPLFLVQAGTKTTVSVTSWAK